MAEPLDIRFTAGDPTEEEIAAVTAVLSAALEELSARPHGDRRSATPTGWSRSQRALRSPLTPGPGRWAQSVR
jgi:hypothetical protein